MRCLESNRTCKGYVEQANSKHIFRQHVVKDSTKVPLPSESQARKCSLPARVPAPGTSFIPDDLPPKEETEESIEGLALRAFFYDYCVPSTNLSLSRGFFHGIERMVHHRGSSSDFAQACKAVAFASHGIKLRRPLLTQNAGMLYHRLIASLAREMSGSDLSPRSLDVLAIVVLLGVYEMIVADDMHPGYHGIHAGGMAAVLRIENSPLGLLKAVKSKHHLLDGSSTRGLFSPNAGSEKPGLDNILLDMSSFLERAKDLSNHSPENLRVLCWEARELNEHLAQWQDERPTVFKLTTVGQVVHKPPFPTPEAGYWSGNVDVYFDLYVAAAWNISRVARCFLIDLILRISETLQDGMSTMREKADASRQINDMLSSIPYHLCEDLPSFLRDLESSSGIRGPGRAVGGLLLMHPIFALSQLNVVLPDTKEYLRRCLEWISVHMGIGEAARLAKAEEIDMQNLGSGCMIVWMGFLL
ncbi:hypothetical protein BO70DRAFT_287877 [Aspergillus heteromorphus CBS 117.55]|uniref:C6 transcription factor n=1 Tax=Aspergillus heteromorphus CBS 117.55 TaxID=1448321 RepID=A0A317WN79_9EURO|nr:uncharacterized protein BO70DRAFT_287877 [Aspergillus heteromorphus CBS 117.55]PWY86692.1 hypothetical protein BO70DRAFT_287877 [Aspergillus heteromorphus CBS 117.55]